MCLSTLASMIHPWAAIRGISFPVTSAFSPSLDGKFGGYTVNQKIASDPPISHPACKVISMLATPSGNWQCGLATKHSVSLACHADVSMLLDLIGV
jgi:hypothetical protein